MTDYPISYKNQIRTNTSFSLELYVTIMTNNDNIGRTSEYRYRIRKWLVCRFQRVLLRAKLNYAMTCKRVHKKVVNPLVTNPRNVVRKKGNYPW